MGSDCRGRKKKRNGTREQQEEKHDSCSASQMEDGAQGLNNETKPRYSACQEGFC